MKALVLASGLGTRLRPLTHAVAKQLIPVANKPILCHGLETLRDAGITDIGVVVGDTEDAIRAVAGDGAGLGVRLSYIRQRAPRGLAHAVHTARGYLGVDDFVLYLGDNIVDGGIGPYLERFRRNRPDAQILLSRNVDPEHCGVAELDADGRPVRIVEKPHHHSEWPAVAGIYLFGPAVLRAVRGLRPSARHELEITDAIQWLIDHRYRVDSAEITGYWRDAGTVDGVLDANRRMLECLKPRWLGTARNCRVIGPVRVEAGARVSDSQIVGPAVVGADARIAGSRIGPFASIGDECRITDSEITDSVLLHRASVRGVRRVTGSLIGSRAQVAPAPRGDAAHRLIVADDSVTRIGS